MSLRMVRLIGLTVFVLVVVGVTWADPAPPPVDKCTNEKCLDAGFFIFSPALNCEKYDPFVCSLCQGGRCLDPGPTQPSECHPGGAHFLFADGSVRFIPYSADSLVPALATRGAGDTVELP